MAKQRRTYTPRKTAEEKARLIRQATQLMSAPKNRLDAQQCASRLGVSKQWIYYHVGSARDFRTKLAA